MNDNEFSLHPASSKLTVQLTSKHSPLDPVTSKAMIHHTVNDYSLEAEFPKNCLCPSCSVSTQELLKNDPDVVSYIDRN